MRNTESKNRQKHKATFLEKARRRQRAQFLERKQKETLRHYEDYTS